MDRETLRQLLEDVRSGHLTIDAAGARLAALPYEDLGFAKLDLHRALRAGGPEAVFCPGKTAEQVVAIVSRLAVHHANVLATRCDAATAAAVQAAGVPRSPRRSAWLGCSGDERSSARGSRRPARRLAQTEDGSGAPPRARGEGRAANPRSSNGSASSARPPRRTRRPPRTASSDAPSLLPIHQPFAFDCIQQKLALPD